MKKRTGTDYGKLLIVAAVIVSAPRWAGAFVAADSAQMPDIIDQVLQNLNWLSGIGMGVIEVLGTAYMLTEWRNIKPKATWNAKHYNRQWVLLTGFIVGLFLLTPFILSPYMVARMNGSTVAAMNPLWFEYLWNTAVVLSPAFIIGGVAVARDGLVGVVRKAESPSETVAKQKEPLPKPLPEKKKEYRPGFDKLLTREKVLVYLEDNPGASYPEIAALANVSPARIGQLVRDLESRGQLTKNGTGYKVKEIEHD